MDIATLITQLIAGAIGGNAAGSAVKDFSLGPGLNTILGAIGGALGGQVLGPLLGFGPIMTNLDIGSIISAFASGGVSGGLVALVAGFLKSRFVA